MNNNVGILDPSGNNLNPINEKKFTTNYKNLAKFWAELPAYDSVKKIIKTIIDNDIILISSGTGSGKTVLVPKYALHANEYKGNIVVTLPKKIITKKAAEFAAKTLDVKLGKEVGYQFRGDNKKSKDTILLYSTDGSIISQLKSDPLLKKIDIIIIDEAHERKIQIDLLLFLLKNSIRIRKEKNMKPLKLIIMSATINVELFRNYYSEFNFDSLFLTGTPNFPIESIYLKSSLNIKKNEYVIKGKEIIKDIIYNINNKSDKNNNNINFIEGDILFFVCTIAECDIIAKELSETLKDCFIMPLYSSYNKDLEIYLSSPDKYKELNSNYKRRIFISTNVAESSLTIDGIVYVIDSGLELSVNFDPTKNINSMSKHLITQAQMTQRKGRAGRTKPGICYHLYTNEDQNNAALYPEPEIKTVDLKNTTLSLLKLGSKIYKDKDFNIENTIDMYLNFIQPPLQKFMMNAFDFIIKNNIVNKQFVIDYLGDLISESRLNIQDAITLVYAYNISSNVFKVCFKIICICSYIKNTEDLLYEDIDKDEKKIIFNKLKNKSENSEHILLYLLYKEIEDNQDTKLYNLRFFKQIKKIYKNQEQKIFKIFKKFNIKINVNTKDLKNNVIYSFNYGYKDNLAIKKGNNFIYNKLQCDLSKSIFEYNNFKKIIFNNNLNYNNKFGISICSPYLLD
jgi:HrpA-like RNA helicase